MRSIRRIVVHRKNIDVVSDFLGDRAKLAFENHSNKSSFITICIGDENIDLADFKEWAKKQSIQYVIRTEHNYSDSEMNSARLLLLIITSESKLFGGPTYGTQYNFEKACKKCGTGAVQVSNLRLKTGEIPTKRNIFQTLDGEIIIRENARKIIPFDELTGVELRPIEDLHGNIKNDTCQLITSTTMPPMDKRSTLLQENPCPVCKKDGYFWNAEEGSIAIYSSKKFNDHEILDFTSTCECFGNSRLIDKLEDCHFAAGMLVLSSHAYRKIKGMQGVQFIPIQFID